MCTVLLCSGVGCDAASPVMSSNPQSVLLCALCLARTPRLPPPVPYFLPLQCMCFLSTPFWPIFLSRALRQKIKMKRTSEQHYLYQQHGTTLSNNNSVSATLHNSPTTISTTLYNSRVPSLPCMGGPSKTASGRDPRIERAAPAGDDDRLGGGGRGSGRGGLDGGFLHVPCVCGPGYEGGGRGAAHASQGESTPFVFGGGLRQKFRGLLSVLYTVRPSLLRFLFPS